MLVFFAYVCVESSCFCVKLFLTYVLLLQVGLVVAKDLSSLLKGSYSSLMSKWYLGVELDSTCSFIFMLSWICHFIVSWLIRYHMEVLLWFLCCIPYFLENFSSFCFKQSFCLLILPLFYIMSPCCCCPPHILFCLGLLCLVQVGPLEYVQMPVQRSRIIFFCYPFFFFPISLLLVFLWFEDIPLAIV